MLPFPRGTEVGDGSLWPPRLIARRSGNNEEQFDFVHICGGGYGHAEVVGDR